MNTAFVFQVINVAVEGNDRAGSGETMRDRVRDRERERETDRQTERERWGGRENHVCYQYVCGKEIEF